VTAALWGFVVVHSSGEEPLPPDTEERLVRFADLAGTSVANASARAELRRLVAEQDALRRIATLVARQPPLGEVFTRVVDELGRLLDVEDVRIVRYEPDGSTTVAATWGGIAGRDPTGTTAPAAVGSVADRILRTARPARSDDPEAGARSTVGSPIVVAALPWGAVIVASVQPGPLPAALSERLSDFTELVATAITNTKARSDLAASRARIVVATDEARRRFERDLHDGAQQRLVALALELHGALASHGGRELEGAEAAASPRLEEVTAQLARAGEEVEAILDELRELSRGIHPAILSEGGLGPALRMLARRSAVPVHLDVRTGGDDRPRLADRIEVATYYVISEALANVAKHAGASQVSVTVRPAGPSLAIMVADDGVGGADPDRGSGLLGIMDRVEALGGTVRIDSPAGAGTALHALLPLDTDERRWTERS
jgi:signal transduction histidine kinase